jgi:hypothetical protein
MAGLFPAIHVLFATKKNVDARHKAGMTTTAAAHDNRAAARIASPARRMPASRHVIPAE